jgi:hypothetical protein
MPKVPPDASLIANGNAAAFNVRDVNDVAFAFASKADAGTVRYLYGRKAVLCRRSEYFVTSEQILLKTARG